MASTSADIEKKEKKKKKDKEFEYEKQADDEETLEQEEALGTDQADVKVRPNVLIAWVSFVGLTHAIATSPSLCPCPCVSTSLAERALQAGRRGQPAD